MDNKEYFETYEKGFRSGYLQAVQETVSVIRRLIDNHPSWMLEPERRVSKASINLAAKHLLQKRGCVPYDHDVITGKAEKVSLDFDMKV